MKKLAVNSARLALRAFGFGLAGAFVAIVVVAIVVLESRDDLELWHTVDLDEEFTRHAGVGTFEAYRQLEDRLFAELDEKVYAVTEPADEQSINRFRRGSLMDPERWETNWNRTFVMDADSPRAGVLLLHGMSDSPYSMRHLATRLHEAGATVIGLRIPGHGTAPSGLVRVHWKDMAEAVALAVRHLADQVGDRPLFLVGYSNGGALAIDYALEACRDEALPAPDGVVLFSPAIGVTSAAALAVWQGRLGRWFGFDKLAWNSIALEYDPFKYGSFAVNAGDQTYRLTLEIRRHLESLGRADRLGDFPPVLAFQSAVDATVSTSALVTNLFDSLPPGGHELVLFDINRVAGVERMLAHDPADDLTALLARPDRPFAVSVVTNRDDENLEVVVRRQEAGGGPIVTEEAGLAWPEDVYSLSHIALPFPESDRLYGGGDGGATLTLGNITLRGERGAIRLTPGDMLRQRWNPFYPLVERRVLAFLGLEDSVSAVTSRRAASGPRSASASNAARSGTKNDPAKARPLSETGPQHSRVRGTASIQSGVATRL